MTQNTNFYTESYHDSLNETVNSLLTFQIKSYGSVSTFIRGCLVLLLRAGLVLVQLGSIPTENVYIILLQNIVDIAVCIASFGLVGYILAFGYDVFDGFVGHGMWIVSDTADLDNAVFGFSANIIATGIITTVLAGRVHFAGYLLTSMLFSMLIQPIIMHWIWHESGWMYKKVFLDFPVSVKDHAGGIVVHETAGIVSLVGALCLGSRLIKLSDIAESSIGAESPGSTITGYIFIAIGLIAFSIPPPSYELIHVPYNYIGIVLTNNIMAMASGIITVVSLHFMFYRETINYWIILRCMQGAIAGIVAIAAGVDVYTPILSFAVGAVAAVAFNLVLICIYNSSIEDYCNVLSLHLLCGTLGSCLPPLVMTSDNFKSTIYFKMVNFIWQIICIVTVGVILLFIFMIYFCLLRKVGILRNKSEEINHRQSKIVQLKIPDRHCLQRIFTLHPDAPLIEPCSYGKNLEEIISHKTSSSQNDLSREQNLNRNLASERTNSKTANKNPIDASFSKAGPSERHRFVYTMLNSTFPFKHYRNITEGSGDYLKTDSDTTAKTYTEKLAIPTEKGFSYNELHRTKKYTNLFKNRIVLRTRNVKTPQKIAKSQWAKCSSLDKNYSNKLVTIKISSLEELENYSDVSDN